MPRDLGAGTPTSGKENSDAFHRLAVLQVGKDSSPNTLAAEATAIAGITALTQVSPLTPVRFPSLPRKLTRCRDVHA